MRHARARFLERGFRTVRTEDLASELGISKKTLYRFFRSKNEIVMAVARDLTAEIDDDVSPLFESDAPFEARFPLLIRSIARHVGSIGGAFMADLALSAPEVWQEIDRFRRERILGRLEGLIERGIRDGAVDPAVNAKLFVAIVSSIAASVFTPEQLMRLGVGPRDVVRFVLRLLSVGILTEKGRAALAVEETNER